MTECQTVYLQNHHKSAWLKKYLQFLLKDNVGFVTADTTLNPTFAVTPNLIEYTTVVLTISAKVSGKPVPLIKTVEVR